MNIQWQNSENVKINNTNTSAILEDSSEVLSFFADKYIITKYPIKTGDLVEYAGITYIVVSQIDRNIENRKENQYNYRARIRQADFTIKIVIDGKVEIFPSIIEGQTFDIIENKIIDVSSDKIIVTLKASDISNKIIKTMRFIKLGDAWKVVGVDKTKLGLIILFCDSDSTSHLDDIENEIANADLIKDNPVEPEPEPEPTVARYEVTPILQYQDDTPYQIYFNSWQKYTIKKFVDDVEVNGNFTFELSSTKATLSEATNNSCKVSVASIVGKYVANLIVTDADTNEIAIEKSINIMGR
ncbi:hypothetical protein [Tissierella pigra]|uniref:Uncharacterized protein n=1 Tax=Tissierella pigra TaxID=2607614 RepID=A0A6N7XKV1_9FIRM|nr:hypothetical protein [Tissierella pigra]MSU01412.1 hypothetical protein [Tissierella pigra]